MLVASPSVGAQPADPGRFHLQDASVSDIQRAIVAKQITSVALVELYLNPTLSKISKYGDRLWVAILDVTDSAAVHNVIDRAFAELQRIDGGQQCRLRPVRRGGRGRGCPDRAAHQDESIWFDRGGARGDSSIPRAVGQAAYPTMGVYAATKWGIEGFFEGTIPEVTPFGIEVTLVEPGASRTNFASSSADAGQVLDVYDQTPAGDFRRLAASAGLDMFPGDPRKVAAAIIASAEQSPAPKRLTLGSDL